MDLRIFVEPQQGASYDDQLAVARVADDLDLRDLDHLELLADRVAALG